jgi:type II secretory ATPase GspE/PulE/Tfp pilus assembly ATPase PilB-like protein
MLLDKNLLEKHGIIIDDNQKPVIAYVPPGIALSVSHDLWLSFDGQIDIKTSVDTFELEKNRLSDRDTEIFSEVDEYISETEFVKTAEVALSAHDENDAPIVRLFNTLLSAAISRKASDLHIDPGTRNLLVRMRIDGVISDFTQLDKRVAQMIISRIKLVANLDITEKRLPQDGRMNVSFKGSSIDIRVATLPTKNGERVVLRFFSNQLTHAQISDTSLAEKHVNSLLEAISHQSGLILVCGPTGSGKTTTIYSLLNTLVDRGLNIMTVEDPVEVEIPKIIQTQVNDNVGFNFAKGLRSLLRNDPDVILIGEIRDAETAEIAVRAAMTGHLVISTVHANTPISAIKRLLNLNIDQSLLSDCLLGVYSQRLVRVYCADCKAKSIKSSLHKSSFPGVFEGCQTCNYTGFSGRIPVMSHLKLDSENIALMELNLSKMNIIDTMEEEALSLFNDQNTSLFEITRLKQNI